MNCAVDSAGTAYCWGTNSTGQDGSTTTTPSANFAQPVVVSPPQASTLATGLYHACDLRAGQAYCWGNDTYGELGNNTTSTTAQSTPVAVYTGGGLERPDPDPDERWRLSNVRAEQYQCRRLLGPQLQRPTGR